MKSLEWKINWCAGNFAFNRFYKKLFSSVLSRFSCAKKEEKIKIKKSLYMYEKVVNLCMIKEKLQNDGKEIYKEFKFSWNGTAIARICIKSYTSRSINGKRFNCSLAHHYQSSSVSQSIFSFLHSSICPLQPKN